MDKILLTFSIFSHFCVVYSDFNILPPIFELDDYITCLDTKDLYCKVDVKLRNNGYGNNTLWKIINDSNINARSYDRSIFHRGICIPKEEATNFESTKKFSELIINKKFNETGLHALVQDLTCTTTEKVVYISSYEIFLLISVPAYLSLTLYATLYERQKGASISESTREKFIISFSLISNWRKICNTQGNEDYNKLRSVQGIRFYNMLLVIALHTVLSSILIELSNPYYAEKVMGTRILTTFIVLGTFLVQTYFLISAWMVTFQIYNIYKEHGKFTFQQAFILIINRFFRIGVCSTVMLILLTTDFYRNFDGPINFDKINLMYEACKQNGWKTFYFVNNYLYFGDTCHPPSWYLSVDFQLYTLAVLTIYLILKFKLNEGKVISYLIILSCVLYGFMIYINEMDIIARFNLNNMWKFCRSEPIRILYTSTYSSWTTSLIGIWFGIIYTKYKNVIIADNKVLSILWLLIFFGLPSAVIWIADYEFNGIEAAIIGPLVKPLYSFGIGVGILGMSHNIGGIIKRICENKFILLMSNFTFCIYIFQFVIIFSKGMGSYSLVEFGYIQLIKSYFFVDAPLSLLVGIACALMIEQPGINLQKLFLPQISRGRKHPPKHQ